MTITAARCVLVRSRWVHAFILTCDDKLAVWFKRRVRGGRRVPGVCCYYPNSNRNFFNLAITWGSPGKFVHRFLYRRLAYQIINPPCPAAGCNVAVNCCPAALPATLHASGTGLGGSQALLWDGSQYWQSAAFAVGGGNSAKLRFACGAGGTDCTGLTLEYACSADSYLTWTSLVQQAGCSCSPLSVSYDPPRPLAFCNNTVGAITVTT
jgi:hypothetical protein